MGTVVSQSAHGSERSDLERALARVVLYSSSFGMRDRAVSGFRLESSVGAMDEAPLDYVVLD